jgi:O-antigen/teichoic acid export membrane protein
MSTDTRSHLAWLIRGGALSMGGATISTVAGFLLVILITTNYEKVTAGVLFSAASLFMVALSLVTLGTDVGLGRFVLRFAAESRNDAIRSCIKTAITVVVVLSVATAAVLLVVSPQLADLMGLGDYQGSTVIIILAVALPVSALGSVALDSTRAFGLMSPTVAIDRLGRSLAQPAFLGVCVISGSGILALTTAWVLPYVLAAVAACLVLHRVLERRAPRGLDVGDTPVIRREFWTFTWPRSIASVSQILLQRADIIIVGALISPSAAAVYTAATRFVAFGKFGVQALQQVLQPQFTHLLATQQHEVLRDVFKISSAWSVLLAWPIYLAIGCAPAVYLSVFGASFVGAGTMTVVVMMLGMLVAIYSGPVDTLLLMSGRSTTSLINSLTALAIDIGLCFLLIPRLGISGAAFAWALAVTVRAGLAYFQVRRSQKISALSTASAIAAGASIGCFALPMLGLTLTGTTSFVAFAAVGLGGTVVYLAVLRLARRSLHLESLSTLFRRPGVKELRSSRVDATPEV